MDRAINEWDLLKSARKSMAIESGTRILEFTIDGELPALNEIIASAKSHFGAYSTMKKKHTNSVNWFINRYVDCDVHIDNPADITIAWFAKNKRKDPDNISAGKKFILDALVQSGVMKNDTWGYVNSISDKFFIDKNNPRIEVMIEY